MKTRVSEETGISPGLRKECVDFFRIRHYRAKIRSTSDVVSRNLRVIQREKVWFVNWRKRKQNRYNKVKPYLIPPDLRSIRATDNEAFCKTNFIDLARARIRVELPNAYVPAIKIVDGDTSSEGQ